MPEISDEALVLALRGATEQQSIDRLFEEVFHRYHARVVNWCYAVARDREVATDLAQEVFLKVFRNLHAFRGDSRMSTWIYVITRNHCLNSIKKWKTEPDDYASDACLAVLKTPDENVHSALERAQSFDQLIHVLGSLLTPMEIRILTLHYMHELTLPDITRNLMLSNRSGAKAYLVRAHRKLRILVQEGRWNQSWRSVRRGELKQSAAA